MMRKNIIPLLLVALLPLASVFGSLSAGAAAPASPSHIAFAPGSDSVAADSSLAVSLNKASIVDEVIWVIGDEPILKSDVEQMRMQAAAEGIRFNGDPDCAIPEQIAVQKLFLHQAVIDSIDKDVTEADISAGVEDQISRWVDMIGSREKLEEYKKESITQLRAELHDDMRDRMLVQKMQQKLVQDIKVTPAEVRRYFADLPEDSIPFVPTEYEVQIITLTPRIDDAEINRIKERLREFTDRINSGDASFATLARLYSQDGSARNGGELGYTGRAGWVPEFANVAFNLTDPKKVSKIVETEYGYHIIQLIDKRGDKVNARHILLKPEVSDSAVMVALGRLDSLAADIRADRVPEKIRKQLITVPDHFTFEDAVSLVSDDKKTRSNHGLMANVNMQLGKNTSKFRLQELPAEVARMVDTLTVGQVSAPFQMINESGKTVCAIVRLKSRVDGHRATVTEDFQVLKDMVLGKRREDFIHQWVVDKIKATYVRINPEYRDCHYEYDGWVR